MGSANGVVSGDFDLGDILKNAAFSAAASYLASSINLNAGGDPAGATVDAAKANDLTRIGKVLDKKFSIIGGEWGDGFKTGLFDGGQLTAANVLEGAFDGAISSGLSSAVYGTDFKTGLRNSVVRNIVALGLADTQNEIGKVFNDNANGGEGSLGHALLHGVAGCAAAELQGASCAAGAAGGIAQSIYAGSISTTEPTPDQFSTPEEFFSAYNIWKTNALRSANIIGGIAGYAFSGGKGENVSVGALVARSGLDNNYLNHSQWVSLGESIGDCEEDSSCEQAVYEEYKIISLEQQEAYADCLVSGGDCISHREAIYNVNIFEISQTLGFDVSVIQDSPELQNLLQIQNYDTYSTLLHNGDEQERLAEFNEGCFSTAANCVKQYRVFRQQENENFLLAAGALTATAIVAASGASVTIAAAQVILQRATAACLGNAICTRTVVSAELTGTAVDVAGCAGGDGLSCVATLVPVVTNGGGIIDDIPDVFKTPQIVLNRQNGLAFENSVVEVLSDVGGAKNTQAFTITLDSGKSVTTIPDLWGKNVGGVLEAKNVINISNSDQFRAQLVHAMDNDLPFNLIVSPRTQHITEPLLKEIDRVNTNYKIVTGHTAGGVYRFDPATGDLTNY